MELLVLMVEMRFLLRQQRRELVQMQVQALTDLEEVDYLIQAHKMVLPLYQTQEMAVTEVVVLPPVVMGHLDIFWLHGGNDELRDC